MATPVDISCPNATPLAVQVATDNTGGSFRWRMTAARRTPRTIRVSPNGDLDFSGQVGPIRVTMRLTGADWTWRAQNLMEFNDEPQRIGPPRNFVRPDNPQVKLGPISADGREFSFCYQNSARGGRPGGARHPTSYYGLWVQSGEQTGYIDPIIHNGGRPHEEDPEPPG
jgi:hypothetical protein